ncbi:MAG: hypothetical protein AAFV80_07955 [Bacteroidota bacterium]
MELVFRICLFLAGVINVLPALLAFLPDRIPKAYGVAVPNANYELLLRHRAVLFGIVGGVMIYSAVSQEYYTLATQIGLISMLSFVALYWPKRKSINAELKKVMQIDLIGILILIVGYILFKYL